MAYTQILNLTEGKIVQRKIIAKIEGEKQGTFVSVL